MPGVELSGNVLLLKNMTPWEDGEERGRLRSHRGESMAELGAEPLEKQFATSSFCCRRLSATWIDCVWR